MSGDQMIRIYKYKNVKLPFVFYCYDKNEFYTKENLNYQNSKILKWKKIHRQYKNKNNEEKDKTYYYINFNIPETQEKIRINEKEWLKIRDDVIKENKMLEN